MKLALLISIGLMLFAQSTVAQVASYRLETEMKSPMPNSNTASDILMRSDSIWFGTGRGLTLTNDAGKTWSNFANTATFDEKDISAIAIRNSQIWVATGFITKLDNESIQTGGGLHYSLDGGKSWKFVPQPVDTGTVDTLTYGKNKIPAIAVTVVQQNITFDISLTTNAVWTASWAGMLRKSTDLGKTWQRVILPPDNLNQISPTDSLKFDLSHSSGRLGLSANLNHLVFAVYASDDSTIWVGTAGGINKSTDGGVSWRKFSHQNQSQPISGNFVVALNEQRIREKKILWAATRNASDPDEVRAVSLTEDGGSTWKTTLPGIVAWNITFKDSIVYIATDEGLFRSADAGMTWVRSGTIYDPTTLQRFASTRIFAVGARGDTIWVGGPEGIAYTIDGPAEPFGKSWKIFRTFQPVAASLKTYSYPSPFSPDDEVVRLHFSTQGKSAAVTIRIFDFAMQPVRTLIRNAIRSGSIEHDEIWDGRDDLNRRVANGVFFYRVEIEGLEPQWGKIFVLQ